MQLNLGIEIISKYVKTLTQAPGIYQMLDEKQNVLYVGKAKNLKKRVGNYTQIDRLSHRLQRMVAQTKQMKFVKTHTEFEALLLENNLIGKLKPKYNILVYDDSRALFLALSKNHEFPRLFKYRGVAQKKNRLFGPLTSSASIESTMVALQKVFLLRTCSDTYFKNRNRPCLQYYIKRCSAPCVGEISTKEYEDLVKQATAFLEGKTSSIRDKLTVSMQKASSDLEYERAIFYRNRLKALSHVQSYQKISTNSTLNADVIAIVKEYDVCCIQLFVFRNGKQIGHNAYFKKYTEDIKLSDVLGAFLSQYYSKQLAPSHVLLNYECDDKEFIENALSQSAKHKVEISKPTRGVKLELVKYAQENAAATLKQHINSGKVSAALLNEVAKIFALSAPPKRIEVYDNSHTSGVNAYGAMIVATAAGLLKSAYKRFSFSRTAAGGGDDYSMMRQMIARRFDGSTSKDEDLPDLMIIDGGKGQLSAAVKTLKDLDITKPSVIAMAKGKERNKGREVFWLNDSTSIKLPENSDVLYYLQRLRDEAHRFCINAHRAKNVKQMRESYIDAIPGIGPLRRRALIAYFGSIDGVIAAGIKDLQKVKGISKATAQKIHSLFHA